MIYKVKNGNMKIKKLLQWSSVYKNLSCESDKFLLIA